MVPWLSDISFFNPDLSTSHYSRPAHIHISQTFGQICCQTLCRNFYAYLMPHFRKPFRCAFRKYVSGYDDKAFTRCQVSQRLTSCNRLFIVITIPYRKKADHSVWPVYVFHLFVSFFNRINFLYVGVSFYDLFPRQSWSLSSLFVSFAQTLYKHA